MTEQHPRADLIVQAVQDITKPIWWRPREGARWDQSNLHQLVNCVEGEFHVGACPAPECCIGAFTFPRPMRTSPPRGSDYWVVTLAGMPTRQIWDGQPIEHQWLDAGLVQATENGAKRQRAALFKAMDNAFCSSLDRPAD